ncbi:MAG: YraN family protein, partial [Alphaproteobacteria bacterium]|nr:YraN family protein [Alphaproteobacteria bacterium]
MSARPLLSHRQRAYVHGLWMERAAAAYLRLKGYKILAVRYKTPVGEIDIIARKGRTLVAVEVKHRQNIMNALNAVSRTNQMRIERALRHFITRYPRYSRDTIRFDVIAASSLIRFR